jgi:hypothetical protein
MAHLSFKLDNNLSSALKKIDNDFLEKFSLIKQLPAEELEVIHRYARISTIGTSTRIDNALLTDSELTSSAS